MSLPLISQLFNSTYWNDNCDVRTKEFWLIKNGPLDMFIVITIYFAFVTKIGPRFMKNREPYQLRNAMVIYNFLLVGINIYFFFEALYWIDYGARLLNFRFPDGNDTSPKALYIARSFHLYYLTKIIDLFDTVFFVLRKKYNQISGLHLYHHMIVPVIGFLGCWLSPLMPSLGLFAVINCFIHVVMYTYYGLSAIGPQMAKYLWWKKYITIIQLTQFVIFAVYGVALSVFNRGYPFFFRLLPLTQSIIFFSMFFNFYIKAYKYKSAKKGTNQNNNSISIK